MRRILPLAVGLLPLPVMAEVPRVVTDIPPVHALVAMVMGDLGTPDLLLDKGANAHSFQLRPSQAAGLQAADMVVWVGPQMTPWLDRALDGVSVGGHRLELLDAKGTFLRKFGDQEPHDHDDDHKAEAEHADHAHEDDDDHKAEAGHEDHAHDGVDPHAWLDPANALLWLDLIAGELAEHDPANAATYGANAAAAKAGIADLDRRIAAELAPVQGKPFVVFHDAYGYFAAHYSLAQAGSIALGDSSAPGAGRLRELRAQMVSGGIVCAFPEAQHDPKLVQTLVEGTAVKVGPLLDPSGSSLEPGPALYAALLGGLSANLRACLGG